MFVGFFFHLRARGLDVSLGEWMTLIDGIRKGLHCSTLTGFYRLCRAVIVRTEDQFDRFDQAFLEFFKDVPWKGEIPDELLEWLNTPIGDISTTLEELRAMSLKPESFETILKMLEERIEEQEEQHDGGSYWLGTHGASVFGNSGWRPGSFRIGDESMHKTAIHVAEERRFRDFRKDNRLDTRQFQSALRGLRAMTAQDCGAEREPDIDGTIRDTCDNAGTLRIRWRTPRKNSVKVLLLMDSGGSMDYYASLCSAFFHAATKLNRFKELKTYYFHNCVYADIFTLPSLEPESRVATESLFRQYDGSYKTIIVGDAAMSPHELHAPRYIWGTRSRGESGLDWLTRIKGHFHRVIWLNPDPLPKEPNYRGETHYFLSKMFKMFELTPEGIELGMKELMRG